jgi:large subunit ribosomal protein L24
MHIKKGDTVKVISGDDRGQTGKVLQAFPKLGKAVVEGVNVVKKHQRARKEGQKGIMVDIAMPMSVSNLVKADEVKEAKVPAKIAAAKKEPSAKKEPKK